MATFLDTLKVGDRVIVISDHNRRWIARVVHITPTRRFTINTKKFNSRRHQITDDIYHMDVLEAWTQEKEDKIRQGDRAGSVDSKH